MIGKNYVENITQYEKSSTRKTSKDFSVNDTWVNQKIYDSEFKTEDYELTDNTQHYLIDTADDPFPLIPDVVQDVVFGPCLIFGGQTAKWTGNSVENRGIIALESRLNFETKAGKRVLATFEIFNLGTTAIYYDWNVITHFT